MSRDEGAETAGITERTQVSKGLRFAIFRRDGFTCQYCGAQPPGVVLHVDHITPVVEGGTNDDMNLVTACDACNLGKGRELLDRPHRPDADLAWLEAQQELAELRRYQRAKAERDRLLTEIAPTLQATWCDCSGLDWHPADAFTLQLLHRYGPELVERAFVAVAPKISGGYIHGSNNWIKYLHVTLATMQRESDW